MPLGRFDLFVVLRNQVRDKRLVRRALAVEAVMEELAKAAGADAERWGLAGLGADIDAALCARAPERLGKVASELLLAEGAPADVAAAAATRRAGDPAELAPMAAALCAADALVGEIHAQLEDGGLDGVQPAAVAHRLRRAVERRGDEAAKRVLACLERAGVPLELAAEAAVAGMVRVREDLGL
jgi:predicted hydrolase (HD superfamily)